MSRLISNLYYNLFCNINIEENTSVKPIPSENERDSPNSATDSNVAREGSKAVSIPAREDEIYLRLVINIK